MKGFRSIAAALLVCLLVSNTYAADCLHTAYLEGYPDGTLRPEQALTREQLAQILYRLLPEEERKKPELCWFSDVSPERWSYAAVSKAAKLGLLYGDPEGRFSPASPVTGPELAVTFSRIANTLAGNRALPKLAEAWSEREIRFETGFGWVMGLQNGVFDENAPLTRGQAAQIFNDLLGRKPAGLDALLIGMPVFSDNTDTESPFFLDLQEAAVEHTCTETEAGEVWIGLG